MSFRKNRVVSKGKNKNLRTNQKKESQVEDINSFKKRVFKEVKRKKRVARRKHNKERIQKVKTTVRSNTRRVVRKSWDLIHNLGAGFWILIIFIALIILAFWFNVEELVLNIILDYSYFGIFTIVFFSELLVQPVGPDIPLIIALVFTSLNPFWVIFSVVMGSLSSLILAYFIGKKLGAPGIERIIGSKKWSKIEKNDNYGKWLLFIGSISPVPYIPYLTGLFEMSIKEIILYVLIPRNLRFLIVSLGSLFFGSLMEKLFL